MREYYKQIFSDGTYIIIKRTSKIRCRILKSTCKGVECGEALYFMEEALNEKGVNIEKITLGDVKVEII